MIWSYLIHLGTHMWADKDGKLYGLDRTPRGLMHKAEDKMRTDKEEWIALTNELVLKGVNTLIIDLGEGVKYETHPELAIEGSWSVDELKAELKRLRSIGLNPIPKLNFATTHDEWLGEYSRMVSTSIYYRVCADLIKEVCEIFDTPDYFHIGMDEEAYHHQKPYSYAVVRHGDLWWHDVLFLINEVEKNGSCAWMWSDNVVLQDENEYVKRMPKSVLQSIWYYDRDFSFPGTPSYPLWDAYKYYSFLDKHGYKQVPTGSIWMAYENITLLSEFCKEQISKENLLGYMMTTWYPTIKDNHSYNVAAADILGQVRRYDYDNI